VHENIRSTRPLQLAGGPFCGRLKGVADLGRMLIFLGLVVVVVGVFFVLIGKANLPLGRLPGDILYRGKNTTFYFPLATSILLSVILSVAIYVIGKLRH